MLNKYIILVIIIFLSGCVQKSLEIYTSNNIVRINVEVADNTEKRFRGLMYRENLHENNGMLFVFNEENIVTFWMKNTFIPLDMIFISSNGTINEIKENVQPCKSDPCELYISKHPSMYVLEVNANFTKKNNIRVGDFVKIK